MADFALVAGLVTVLFMAVVQVGFALHVRNTLIWCASEGARYGARADSDPGLGVHRARDLIRDSVSASYGDHVTARRSQVSGVQVVEVTVVAPLPVIGTLGPTGVVTVSAHAFAEGQ